jgi:membrane protein implicated in regulation of membrane protease activity
MGMTSKKDEKKRNGYAFNLTLAAVAGQVGCLTLVIVLAALFTGLWLDNYFQTKPMITLLLMVASVPLTLVLMFWVVKSATSRLQKNPTPENKNEEEAEGGR